VEALANHELEEALSSSVQEEAYKEEAAATQELGELVPNSRLETSSIAIAVSIDSFTPQTY
jgi:hypothetical protein